MRAPTKTKTLLLLAVLGCGGGDKKDLGRVPNAAPDAMPPPVFEPPTPKLDAGPDLARDVAADLALLPPVDAILAAPDLAPDLPPGAPPDASPDAVAGDSGPDTAAADAVAGADAGPDAPADAAVSSWAANLQLEPVDVQTIGGTGRGSSTKLRVSWSAPAGAVDHYLLRVTDNVLGASTNQSVPAGELARTLSGLGSDTSYTVVLSACLDASCSAPLSSASGTATASTPPEVWQLQGTGHAHGTLTRVVSDGNVKIHAFRYGDGAPAAQLGRVQLYYGSSNPAASGLAVATGDMVASAAAPSTVLSFTSLAGAAGLIMPASPAPLVSQVNTGQALPLANGQFKLYFEATGADSKTRILSVNSQDGLVGRDFNAGASGVCSTSADYNTGGGCNPKVLIGVEGDTLQANPKLRNVRQFKVGVPTATDWRWDGAAGTFMVFTTDMVTGCSTSNFNHGYAVWDGADWHVQYDGACPKLFTSVQAATPLHLGGARFKLYYGDPSITAGKNAGSMLPFLGPKKLMYADGARTGAAATVDFEDWDGTARARELLFVWPDETPLDATAEGYIDDFVAITPTAELGFQVLYIATTDGTMPPFTAAAILRNP